MRLMSRDVVLALKLLATEPHRLSQRDLAEALHESVGATHNGLTRLHACRLITQDGAVRRKALLGLLVHGVRHVFPVEVGGEGLGLTTGPDTPGLRERLDVSVPTPWVWPTEYAITPRRGRIITPLYEGAPRAAADDPNLHRLLALVDILRVSGGDPSWRGAAVRELRARLGRRPDDRRQA